jgi:hypothetical protein
MRPGEELLVAGRRSVRGADILGGRVLMSA